VEKTERLIVTGWPARARWVVVCAFFLAVNWLLLAPASAFEEVREFLPHQDKLVHGSLFLTLAFLVRWSLAARDGRWWQRLGVFAALVLYAGVSEALQPVLGGAGRRFDWLDMASNLAGVCAGWLLFGMAFAIRPKCAAGPATIKRACDKPAR